MKTYLATACVFIALLAFTQSAPLALAQQTEGAKIQVTSETPQSAKQPAGEWAFDPALLRPFWAGEVVEGESVLFLQDAGSDTARAQVLFPIQEVLRVQNSRGDLVYERGKDFEVTPGSREIWLPISSRIVASTPEQLRRPANTQKYALTHRDGNGEIFFGAKLEYAELQTCITYRHAPNPWRDELPSVYDATKLPKTNAILQAKKPLTMVTLGDSISEGANASGMYNAAPFQPAYPELVRRGLIEHFKCDVTMHNLSVGGKDSAWGVTQVDAVVALEPQLVLIAFGMNDSAGRSAADYQAKTQAIIDGVRKSLPECEFILVASMLGNRDWTRLNHDVFPEYRDALQQLLQPGIVLADLTTVWAKLLELKADWDHTGNGVNHPNDFGHRIYAQVILGRLVPQ